MPEHLRALIVIMALSTVGLLVGRRPAVALGMVDADYVRRRNTWLLMTLLAYLALLLLLQIRYDSGTNTLRTALYHLMDVFLPYYAASRALRSAEDLRDALLAMIIGAALMVPIAAFEFVRHWLLYNSLPGA